MKLPKLDLPVRTTLLYLLFGSLWILLSDQTLLFLVPDSARHPFFQTLKGWFFILVSGALLYLLLLRGYWEHEQAETELRLREMALESTANAIVITDTDGTIQWVNPAYTQLTGYSVGEAIGKNPRILKSMMQEQSFYKTLWDTILAGNVWQGELINRRKDGILYTEEQTITPLINSNGKLTHFIAIKQDITKRKQAEAKIQHQLQRLDGLRTIDVAINSSFDIRVTLDVVLQQVVSQLGVDAAAILLLNPQMQTIEYAASRGFLSNFLQHTQLKLSEGYAGRAVHERNTIYIPDLLEAGGKLAEVMQAAKENFVDYYGTPLISKDGIKGVLEIYHRSPLNPNTDWLDFLETLAGQAAIAIDNSQLFEGLQRTNAELEQRVAQRTAELNHTNIELEHANRAKDEFLATMSHELRTPLSSILGLSEILLEQIRGPLNEKQEHALHVITSSGQHLLGLINDILDVSKVEAGKMDIHPDVINVREIYQSSLNFVKEAALKKSIMLEFNSDPSISTLFADQQRLKQILVNLLSNAVKFTPERGKVTFDVSTNAERDQVHFSVTDNGIGIAPEDLKRLFRPFTQVDSSLARQHQGTGLGLTIVYKLTELHGGSVQVESEISKGSRFTVILPWNQTITVKEVTSPASTKMEKPAEAVKEPPPTKEFRARVLLAEDNEANLMMLGEYLQDQGFEVLRAENGREALAKAEETLPDIIIMDIQMPELDGLEAIQRLRMDQRFISTPIIALTALAMSGDRERCLEAGANEYMSKPVSLKTLAEKIQELLNKEK